MTDDTRIDELSEECRKAIFRAVVESQDQGVNVVQSRALAAERFEVSERQVREIEREGMDQQWPPL